MNDYLRQLTEGSVWIDEKKRTIVVFRIIFSNATTVGSYELLVIPEMKIVKRNANYVSQLVESGKMQFCRECERN
jgi:uncharacterized protein (DUF1499 family)